MEPAEDSDTCRNRSRPDPKGGSRSASPPPAMANPSRFVRQKVRQRDEVVRRDEWEYLQTLQAKDSQLNDGSRSNQPSMVNISPLTRVKLDRVTNKLDVLRETIKPSLDESATSRWIDHKTVVDPKEEKNYPSHYVGIVVAF